MAQDPYRYFRVEARELVDQLGKGLLELEKGGSTADFVPRLLRLAHTLKGAARVVRRPEIADHAHAIEDVLAPFRDSAQGPPRTAIDAVLALLDAIAGSLATLSPATDAPSAAAASTPATASPSPAPAQPAPASPVRAAFDDSFRTVWAEVGEIDVLLEGITETHTQLSSLRRAAASFERAGRLADLLVEQLAARRERDGSQPAGRGDRPLAMAEELRRILGGLDRGVGSAGERMERELRQVRDTAEQLRLVPAGALFTSLERIARDAARSLGKDLALTGKGGDIRLDANVLRVAHEALLQIVRNAVAHGIEPPGTRRAAGKPPAGQITVEVQRRGRRVAFRCTDDGQGIDLEAVRRAAERKGIKATGNAASLVDLLLQGGISTSAAVTEVSGRGIGMDIVRETVARLGGTVTVETNPGKGTIFELIVPLTLASAEALLVDAAGATVAIPFDAVRHALRISSRDIYRTALGDEMIYDGHAIPFTRLAPLLGQTGTDFGNAGEVSAIIVTGRDEVAAIGVDRLRGTANVVFRSLPELAPADAIVAGASLDAEGNPQLVLDPVALVEAASRQHVAAPVAPQKQKPILIVDDSLTTRMLEQSILESAGYDVEMATSAEEGLERARAREYSLFLVDVEMPGMDGFSFIERIRSEPALSAIPAILVTSRNAPEDRRRGAEAGAQGYVVKTEFNQAELLSRIRQLSA